MTIFPGRRGIRRMRSHIAIPLCNCIRKLIRDKASLAMDLSRLQQFALEQMMAVRPPQSQVLQRMPGGAPTGVAAPGPMINRLPVGTSSGSVNPARTAVLPGSSAGAAMSAGLGKGPATKKQKL